MASINFMGPNSLPLISAAAVTAALAQRPTAAVEGPAALTPAAPSATQIVEAKVENVSAKPPGYELTLASGKQSFSVQSELPLPVGTRLTLQVPVTEAEVNVQTSAVKTANTPAASAQLTLLSATNAPTSSVPAAPSSAPTMSQAAAQPTASQPTAQPVSAKPESTVPAVPTGVQIGAQEVVPIKVLNIVLPAQPDSSPKNSGLLQQFMAARVPLLHNQLAPVAADYTSTYQKPNSALALANYVAQTTQTAATDTNTKTMAAPVLTLLNQLLPASIGKEFATSVTNTGPNPALNNTAAHGIYTVASLNTTATGTKKLSAETTTAQQVQTHKMPLEVAAILQKWQQQLPTAADLSQPSGLSQAIKNSGIQYESQVFKTLESMLAKQNPGPLNESAPAQLFKSLWQKAAQLSAAVKHPVALNTASGTNESNSAALAGAANSATANISQVLQAVKAKLEAPLNAASTDTATTTPTSATAPSLLSAILGSDHKAVISRALITWSRLIQKMDSAPMPIRSLPMTPQQDVPETFRLLQSALAQTETEQAQRLNQTDNWQLNIPLFYRDGDMTREVRMHLSKEEQNTSVEAGKKAVRWRLRLHFDLQQLGPLDVDLELQWPALSATFWSEQQQALGLLNKELQPLRKTLTEMGVMVEELQARHGKLPEPSRNVISSRLIDTHS